jgi:hypothetical protein
MKTPLDYETHEGNRAYMKIEGDLLLEVRDPPLSERLRENLSQRCDGSIE